MTWSYRIMRRIDRGAVEFGVFEVYYDPRGKVTSWTREPIALVGDSPADVMERLAGMVRDGALPTLDFETGQPVAVETA